MSPSHKKKSGAECNRINFHECKRTHLSIMPSKGSLVTHLCCDTEYGPIHTTDFHSNIIRCAQRASSHCNKTEVPYSHSGTQYVTKLRAH